MDAAASPLPFLSVVIPVYNEGASFRRLLEAVAAAAKFPFEVLVVYDFEEDDTLPVVRELAGKFSRLRAVKNRFGSGALNALRTGFAEARGDGVVVLMGDGSDDVSVLPRMYQHFCAGSDLICGSRYSPGGQQIGGPVLKKWLSRVAGISLHYLSGLPTRDATNSFKMYRASLLRSLPIESRAGFEVSLELCVKAFLAGYRISEVPCVWRERTAGRSRFRLLGWIPHYLRWYLYALWHRWFGRRPRRAGARE